MRVLLSGASGFVGKEVLSQLLDYPSVSAVFALSRREIPVTHPKLHVLITQDFINYSDDILKELKDIDACIWSLGVTPSKLTDIEEARKVSIDYTFAGIKATMPADKTKTLRFVYISGFMTERDQQKPLWIAQDLRRIRGHLETLLIEKAEVNKNFETCILRSALVLDKNPGPLGWVKGMLLPSVRVDVLAAACIKAAVGIEKQVVQNAEIPHV